MRSEREIRELLNDLEDYKKNLIKLAHLGGASAKKRSIKLPDNSFESLDSIVELLRWVLGENSEKIDLDKNELKKMNDKILGRIRTLQND